MAMRATSRQPKAAPSPAKGSQQPPGSPKSTTASSSRLMPEMSTRLDEDQATKENFTVAVRFRPLSPREIRQGEEVSWYADGDTVVQDPDVCFTYDRVFAPITTTLKVYEVAAQGVVNSAMEGIHGAIFSYGVASSGKTHTMHGDKRSPGIISLAVKDAFSIIQEMPNREFLLRVSYLEIYDEVVSDLLNPAVQNLQIRNDPQSIDMMVPLTSTDYVVETIESNSYGGSNEGEAVTFSQLHIIDLAGPVNSRAVTTGVRRKEISYFNKSVLTLETVISKLAGKARHIPFEDSKLAHLLQSSLSGQGRVSLICTVTPASSNFVETHNTLKNAQLAKQIEVKASQNKIIDEKSLIKKYQNEIRRLKVEVSPMLEEEEEAKSALFARIQCLTKLILVSTKATETSIFSPNPGLRRLSFEEEELAYLPHSRRDIMLDYEINELLAPGKKIGVTLGESPTKKNWKGLNFFKILKFDCGVSLRSSDYVKSSLTKSVAPSTPMGESQNFNAEPRISNYLLNGSVSAGHVGFLSDNLPGEGTTPASTRTILAEEASRNPTNEKIQVNAADNRKIQAQLQEKTSQCTEEQLSQALQAKDSLSNVMHRSSGVNNEAPQAKDSLSNVMQESSGVNTSDNREIQAHLQEKESSGVNNEAQHSDQEKTVPRKILAEPLQNNKEASRLLHELLPHLDELLPQLSELSNQMTLMAGGLSGDTLSVISTVLDKLQQS